MSHEATRTQRVRSEGQRHLNGMLAPHTIGAKPRCAAPHLALGASNFQPALRATSEEVVAVSQHAGAREAAAAASPAVVLLLLGMIATAQTYHFQENSFRRKLRLLTMRRPEHFLRAQTVWRKSTHLAYDQDAGDALAVVRPLRCAATRPAGCPCWLAAPS